MGWRGIHSSVVFQGSDTDDFVTVGAFDEVEIGVVELTEWDEYEGETEEYDDSERVMPTATRRKGRCDTIGFDKFAQDSDSDYQDWGDFLKLRTVMSRGFRRIARTYTLAADHTAGPIMRAREDGDATASLWNLDTDTPTGILPMYINIPDGMRPERDTSGIGSYYTLMFDWEETRTH